VSIAYLGYEKLANDSDGTINALLTIPEGTTHIVASFGVDGAWTGATMGGVALTKASVGEFFFGDIRERTTDYLSSGTKTAGTWCIPLVYYLSANDVQEWEVFSSNANGDHRRACAAPTNGGNVFGTFYGKAYGDLYTPASVLHYKSSGSPIPNHTVAGGCQETVGADNAAVTTGCIVDGLTNFAFRALWVYEAEPTAIIEPSALGMEWGVVAPGPTIVVSEDVTNYQLAIGMEWGVVLPGPRVVPTGPRQVMLTGEGVKTPEMTTGGTEGYQLTYHEDTPPDWQSPGGGGASALDDLTDVDAPAPEDGEALVWDDYAGLWIAAPVASEPTGYYEPVVLDGEIVVIDGDIVMMWVDL
jgi:hypothetical protein